jgi:hypothetical protein
LVFALLEESEDFGFCFWGSEVSVSLEGCVFGGLRDDRKCTQYMGKFKFGESVKVGDDAVEFGAEFGTIDRVGNAVGVAAESYFCGEVIKFWGGTD